MFRSVMFALSLAIPLALPSAAYGQDSDAIAQLEAQLPGKLVNDPTRIDWESYGSDLEAGSIVDESIPGGGAARRFDIKSASEQIYAAGTNIPLTKRVRRGDEITIGFWARTIEARTDDGKGVLRVRFQQDAEPYPGFGETTLEIGNDWEWYEVTTTAEQGLRPKDGIVALQFGRTRQLLEIGQAIVVKGATSIADASAAAPAPAKQALAMPDVEQPLPAPLQATGYLINLPSKRNWGMGGMVGTFEPREEPQIWLENATRFTTERASENASDLYAHIPIESAISEGDELLIAIAARTESASTEDGAAIVGIRVQNKADREISFANNRFKVGPKWQLIRIKTRAPQAYEAGQAQVALHFAGVEQSVDIGPVYVIKTN